jgi:hypothetical protein
MLTVTLGLTLSAGIAIAGTPFGGDDTGFVPPDKTAHKCASKVTTALTKLQLSITSCHQRMANSGVRGTAIDDEPCEMAAKAKFDDAVNRLLAATTCPPCLVAATSGLSDAVESELDASNGDFYCAGITPFGGDDTGFEPLNALYYKGQSTAAKNVAKFAKCVTQCHRRMALYALKGRAFDEEACEATCLAKYNRIRDNILPVSPNCLQQAMQDQLAADTEAALDQGLGTYFCASPGGAFLDPAH